MDEETPKEHRRVPRWVWLAAILFAVCTVAVPLIRFGYYAHEAYSGTVVDMYSRETKIRYGRRRLGTTEMGITHYIVVKTDAGNTITRTVVWETWRIIAKGDRVEKAEGIHERVRSLRYERESGIGAMRRIQALAQIQQQSELIRIASSDEDPDVRVAAATRITDQPTLLRIALGDPAFRLPLKPGQTPPRDKVELHMYIANHPVLRMHYDAVDRLEAEDDIVKVAVTGSARALGRLKKPSALAKVAIGATSPVQQHAALRQVSDLQLLGKIAFEARDPSVRLAAARQITSQAALVRLASHKDAQIRLDAARRSLDEAVLLEMALKDEDENVRKTAAGRITSPHGMAELASQKKKEAELAARVLQMTDQEELGRLALHASVEVRANAQQRVTDQKVLAHAAVHDPDHRLRTKAAERLTEQIPLAMLAAALPEHLRSKAYDKLREPAAFVLVASEGRDFAIRRAALRRLDQAGCRTVAGATQDEGMRLAAAVAAGDLRWPELITEAEQDQQKLPAVICGLALSYTQRDLAERIEELIVEYLRNFDRERAPELRHLLGQYGTHRMAMAYSHCGHRPLEVEGTAWLFRDKQQNANQSEGDRLDH